MKYVMIELAIIALVLFAVAAYAQPMSPEHRAQIDPQGHISEKLRKAYSSRGYCEGHVKQVLLYPQGELVISCYPGKLVQGKVISSSQ
jgi:hypothetical protein